MKTRHGKNQAALPRESSLSPFKPRLDEICIIFTPREPSLHARRANSPSVHPHAKHSAPEPAVPGLPSETHGYPAALPGPRRVFWGTRYVGAHLSGNTTCHRHREHRSSSHCHLGKSGGRAAAGPGGQRRVPGARCWRSPWGNDKPKPTPGPCKPILWLPCRVTLLKTAAAYFYVPLCSFPPTEKAWAEMPWDATKGWEDLQKTEGAGGGLWCERLYWASPRGAGTRWAKRGLCYVF